MGAPEVNTTLIYGIHIRESANDGSDFTNAAADYRIFFLGEDGELHVKDSAGTVTGFAGSGIAATILAAKGDILGASANDTPAITSVGTNGYHLIADSAQTAGLAWQKGNSLKDFAKAKRTGGNVTCNNTSWTAVDTATDLTVDGATGDTLEVGLSAGAFGTEAVTLNLTAMSLVSAAVVNDIATDTTASNTTLGVGAWRSAASAAGNIAGSILYTVVAGDVSTSTVTLRLMYRTTTGSNRVLTASDPPLHFWVKNLGSAL